MRYRSRALIGIVVIGVIAAAIFLARGRGPSTNFGAPGVRFRPPYDNLVSTCRDTDYQPSQESCRQRDSVYTPRDIVDGHVWLCIVFNRGVDLSGTVAVKDNPNDMRALQITWHGNTSKGVGGSHCDRLVVSVGEQATPLVSVTAGPTGAYNFNSLSDGPYYTRTGLEVPVGGYGLNAMIDGQYFTGTGFVVWANGKPPPR